MIRFANFFIVFFLLANNSFASRKELTSKVTSDDQEIYRLIYNICSGYDLVSFYAQSQIWANSASGSSLLSDFTVKEAKIKTSQYFSNLISSQGFHKAIHKCYGSDKVKKDIFFVSLLSLEISGKLVSWASEITLAKLLYSFAKAIVRKTALKPKNFWNKIKQAWSSTSTRLINLHNLKFSEFIVVNSALYGGIFLGEINKIFYRNKEQSYQEQVTKTEYHKTEILRLQQKLNGLYERLSRNQLSNSEVDSIEYEIKIYEDIINQHHLELN